MLPTFQQNYVCNLSEQFKQIAKRDLGEDENVRKRALEAFKSWVIKQNYVKNCRTDEGFLLRFLRCKKFSVINAQESS